MSKPRIRTAMAGWLAAMLVAGALVAQPCVQLFSGPEGWGIDACPSDASVTESMAVSVDGTARGSFALISVHHASPGDGTDPQVAVVYASAFVRLKPNADPSPPVPFGSSFVLGPAYWPDAQTYHHNPTLERLEIDTSWLPSGPLRMKGWGRNHDFDVAYDLRLPPPTDRRTRLAVTQTTTARTSIAVDPTRRAEHQGFKLVQISSMFVSEAGPCDGGASACHDSNAARFIAADGARVEVAFATLTPSTFVLADPPALGSTWLDALHTDDASWQGDTPNVRIALDALPGDRTITPQGWVEETTNPNDDNVSLWLHDDGSASQAWQAGQSSAVSYWLIAEGDPPEPWQDLGLRAAPFLDFEGQYTCSPVLPAGQGVTASLAPVAGYTGTALELRYDLGGQDFNWAQVRCDFDPPLDLSAFDHLRLDWRGDAGGGNSLELGVIGTGAGGERIFGRGYHHCTQHGWWGQLVVPFSFLAPWTPGTVLDPAHVSAIFLSVVKDTQDDAGGAGRLAIDNLAAADLAGRPVPAAFETVAPNARAASQAAAWIAGQQLPSGLVRSWQEDDRCQSHTYDQALALVVFAREGMWTNANALVAALRRTQESNGAWAKSRDCAAPGEPCIDCHLWEGDIAWAAYALGRYLSLGGTRPEATTALLLAADWLAGRVDPADGCLVIDHTEATIDAWWALQAAGPRHAGRAAGLASCLLGSYWDDTMGRFKGGKAWMQPYLDNQTWGAAFLKATGEEQRARRALSYAREALLLPARGGQLHGLDGQAGPWSVWNEGVAQYAAVGGPGAGELLRELLAQQREDGAMPSSPDDFAGGGVWTTRWHGIAPTAWLHFALTGEPFHPGAPPHRLRRHLGR